MTTQDFSALFWLLAGHIGAFAGAFAVVIWIPVYCFRAIAKAARGMARQKFN